MQQYVTFVGKIFKKILLKIKITIKLETIALIQVNIKVGHVAYVIIDLLYLKIFL